MDFMSDVQRWCTHFFDDSIPPQSMMLRCLWNDGWKVVDKCAEKLAVSSQQLVQYCSDKLLQLSGWSADHISSITNLWSFPRTMFMFHTHNTINRIHVARPVTILDQMYDSSFLIELTQSLVYFMHYWYVHTLHHLQGESHYDRCPILLE